MEIFFVGMAGVIVGAIVTAIAFNLQSRYDDRKEERRRQLEHKVKEIEILILLNKKIIEILEKRIGTMDRYVSFDVFDDCHITIDDYIYLQSFAAQNSFYLPNYFLEEFFKKIATRRVVLSPEQVVEVGGYTFKGGRVLMENFSDQLKEMVYERKVQLQKMTDKPMTYFSNTL
jgi:hypothetical protein